MRLLCLIINSRSCIKYGICFHVKVVPLMFYGYRVLAHVFEENNMNLDNVMCIISIQNGVICLANKACLVYIRVINRLDL